jgi:anthranilate/para-aminobenzoate synthase component I
MDNNCFTIIPYKNKLLKFDQLRSGKIIYKNYYFDLISNQKVMVKCKHWLNNIPETVATFFNSPKVLHLFYEIGFLIENIENSLIKENSILAIELEFECFEFLRLSPSNRIRLNLKSNSDFKKYENLFNQGYKELISGNCYQFNLTQKFIYSFSEKLNAMNFVEKIWSNSNSRGAFGSATYIPMLNKLYISNSPECLFTIAENIITSMPIKGTLHFSKNDNFQNKWEQLKNDKKCESELFMIADLIRNDLSRIENPNAQVLEKKSPLLVPGLLHQFSKISISVSDKVKIKTILEKMFPGGSITGAPKKRVMKILANLEQSNRGFYCGSTCLFFGTMKSASINIRSAEVDFKKQQLIYQAGGGITLKSEVQNEFDEMSYKVNSFIDLLTL